MFESLFDLLSTNLKQRNSNRVEIAEEFSEYHNEDSKYIIKNWLFESPQYRRWRITKLDGGNKLQVFNTVAYPSFKSELPILGTDILWFGSSKKLLAVLDYQPLIQEKDYLNKYCSKLNLIKQSFPQLGNTKMRNIYDSNQYFSPWVVIFRGNKLNLDKDLDDIFSLFLNEYFKMNDINFGNKFLNPKQVQQEHINYDKYSAERDPADKLFKTFFGDNWTNNFVKNYLFTLS